MTRNLDQKPDQDGHDAERTDDRPRRHPQLAPTYRFVVGRPVSGSLISG